MVLKQTNKWVKVVSFAIVFAFMVSGVATISESAGIEENQIYLISNEVDISISSDDISLSGEPITDVPVTITANVQGDKTVSSSTIENTLVFSDDFESGTMSKWIKSTWYSGSILEVTTAQSHSPPYSFHAQSNPGTNSGPYIMKFLDDCYSHSITETKFYLPIKTQSVDKWDIIRVGSSVGTVFSTTNYEFYVALRDDDYSIDIFEYVKDANGVWNYGCLAMDVYELAPQTWHDISLEITPTQYILKVGNMEVASGQRAASTLIHHLLIGDEGGVNGCWGNSYWDDVKVWSVSESQCAVPGLDSTCTISFYLDTIAPENLIDSVPNVFVPADGEAQVSIEWVPIAGEHEIVVMVDNVSPPDSNPSNNVASVAVSVENVGQVDISISQNDISLTNELVAGTPVTVTANVQGDISTMNNETQQTLVFSDDFESGNLNKWIKSTWYSGSVLEITTAQSHSPIYSFRAQSNPGTNSGPYIMTFLDDNYMHTITETKFYLPEKAQAIDGWDIIRVGSSTGTVFSTTNYEFYVQLRDDDYSIDITEYAKDASGNWNYGCMATNIYELAPNTWYDISLEITTTEYILRVDGEIVANGQRAAPTHIHHLLIGDEGGAGGCWGDSYWDDVRVWSVTGIVESNYQAQNATCTVSFYLDSVSPENLISSVPDALVPADGEVPVNIEWVPVAGEHEIVVVVDDVNPTDRDLTNNVASISISVENSIQVDLSIYNENISLSSFEPVANQPITINANVQGDRSSSSDWVKHGVVLDIGGDRESLHVHAPSVMKQLDGTYVMWYGGDDPDLYGQQIFRATSLDGISWTKTGMTLNYGGAQQEYAVLNPYVIQDGEGTYHMWYTGIGYSGGYRAYIHRATSSDGITWQKMGLDLNYGTVADPSGVTYPCVYYDGEMWHMWYTGIKWGTPIQTWTSHAHKSSLADPWIKDGIVMANDGIYDYPTTGGGRVIWTGSQYEMYYHGYDSTLYRILHASSTDGLTWSKHGLSMVPTLVEESGGIAIPSIIIEGDIYKMWYGGSDGTNTRILYAEKSPGYDAQDATCTVSFYLDSIAPENLIGSVPDVFVPADGNAPVSIDWIPVAGDHEIIVAVSDVNPMDRDLTNNAASMLVSVSSPEPEPAFLVIEKVKLSGIDEGITHTYYEWELLITVTNNGGSDALDVIVNDVLPAELELLDIIGSTGFTEFHDYGEIGTRAAPAPPTTLPVKSTHITWSVGTLESGQTETLYLKVGTRLNPAGKQEFTSPGIYVINEGAYAEGIDSLTSEPINSNVANAITVSVTDLANIDSNLIEPPTVKLPKTWFFMVMMFACFLPGYKRRRGDSHV